MKHVAIAAFFIVSFQVSLNAWGRAGHQAIATLAEQRLTPAARAAVKELLNGKSMASVSLWADEVRNTTHRDTYNWHFVNIPGTAERYDPARDCQPTPRGDCVIRALERLEHELTNRELPTDQRREALMFIIHFVGDLHQPLHAINNHNDLGGNKVQVKRIGGATNLHAAWDSGIIESNGLTIDPLINAATAILDREGERTVSVVRYDAWAMESFEIAKRLVYPQIEDDGEITESESHDATRVIEERIAYAGVRLAATLNRILDPAH